MKVLACLWDDMKGAATRIIQESDVSEVCFVGVESPSTVAQDYQLDEKTLHQAWEYWDIRYGHYKNVDWNIIEPLGEDLIYEMSDDESYVMEMMERDAVIYSGMGPDNTMGLPKEHFFFADNKYFNFNLSYQQRKRAYFRHLRYWNHFFDHNDVDLIICPTVPHVSVYYIIFRLAWRRGIKTIMLTHTSIPARKVSIYDFTQGPPDLQATYKRLLKEQEGLSLNEISLSEDGQNEYDRLTEATLSQKEPWYRYRPFAEPIGPDISKRIADKANVSGFSSLIKKLKDPDYWHFRLKGLNRPHTLDKKLFKYYDSLTEPMQAGEKYIYIPLHVQPEMTTMPLGGYYTNQQLVIELLASLIPKDWKLYVKENIRQTRIVRDVEFYRDIAALPNVRLMSRTLGTFELMESCEAVATVTGTAAWEGLFKGKPAIMFGYFTTMYAPGAHYVNSAEDVKKVIELIQKEPGPDRRELKIFIQALEQISIRVSRYDREAQQFDISPEDNENRIAEEYLRRIAQLDKSWIKQLST